MQRLGVNQGFLFGLKVVLNSGCCTVSFMAEKDAKSYLLHQSSYSTKGGTQKLYL